MLDFQPALVPIGPQAKRIEIPRGPARRMDHTERARAEFEAHGEAVIGIENIVPDPPIRILVEGLEPTEHRGNRGVDAEGREIEDMNADVAQRAVRTVPGREPPQPCRICPPVAPGL